MDWYRTVGRPLFLSIDPESAHRAAATLLSLPLPWRRIGGVRPDLRQAIVLAGVPLRNPLGLAAGFDKSLRHLDALGSLGFGYVVGGTITRAPRAGNPKPRIVRDPSARSIVNAMGLPNPGAEAAARSLGRARRTAPRFVSLADEAISDAVAAFEILAPLVDGVELNASCPNVAWGRDRDNEAHLRDLLRAFGKRSDRPVFVKLPPFGSDVEHEVVGALARIAQEEGAAGLTCANTSPIEEPRLSAHRGGVSGMPLRERTPEIVAAMRQATSGELPINACGGIGDADDAVACFRAGASTVQIYTSMIYEGPGVVGVITSGLAAALAERNATLPQLVGGAGAA